MRRFITMMVWAMVLFTIGFSSSTAWGYDKPTEMYLFGDINGKNTWTDSNTSNMVKMTNIGDNTWRAEITWTSDSHFRIFTKSANKDNYGAAQSYNCELTASSKDVPTYNKTTQSDGECFYMKNLQGKYIYVTWNDDATGCFTVNIVDEFTPEQIYLYGNVGDYTEWNKTKLPYKDDTKSEKNCYILEKGTKDGKVVYTGKVKFSKDKINNGTTDGKNYFRFYDTKNQVGPNPINSDKNINIGELFPTTYATGATAFCFTATETKEYDVELIYNGTGHYSVTIEEKAVQTPENLYVYSTENYGAPAVTLTKDATSGKYTATLDADGIKKAFSGKRTYYLFLSDENIAGTEWKNFNGHLYTPDGDQTVKNGVATPMAKEDNGAFVWTLQHDHLTNLSFEADLSSNTFTMSATIDDTKNIFIFGKLGYGIEAWSGENIYNQCILTETGTKTIENVTYPVFTGKIKLNKDDNYFRIYGDGKELCPSNVVSDTQNEIVVIGKDFYANTEYTNNSYSWKYTADKDIELDVELVKKGVGNYDVTFKPYGGITTLYVYDADNLADNLSTPYATLTLDRNGDFTGNAPIDNTTHKLFITDKEKTTEQSMQKFTNRWTTTNKDGITLTNNNAFTAISKNTTGGAMSWTLTDKNATAVKMTADLQNGTFTITTTTSTEKYYLSGDINGWEVENNNVASPNLNAYRFVPVTDKTEVGDETGWYVLYVPRMHGQFKIHNGGWGTLYEHWGSTWHNDNTTLTGDNLTEYLKESLVSESQTSANKLGHESKDQDHPYYNLRCAHNYYKNAKIYFNPTDNKLFIDGTPEDIFVYYYNGDDAEEKAGTKTIKIMENEVNVNTNNYYYDKSQINSAMTFGLVTDEERKNYPGLVNVPADESCYKAQVPAGLEEKYRADGKDHYFQFYLKDASKVDKNDMDVFSGHNVYYIYTGTLPAVLFNYKNADGEEVFAPDAEDNVIEICYRLIAIDADGVPQYLKEDGDVTTMTTKRSEATKYILDQKLENGTAGFIPASGTIWHGVKSAAPEQSVMDWTTQVEPVKAGDVNRYVEFDVKLKDPESDSYYHEFTSDFVLSADNDKDAWVQDGQIDQKAQMTGALLPGRDTNPQYKLNGTHLYAMAQTSVPTGIKDIENNEYDEEGEAETVYYNLQGVRVANPDRGIYIMVKGKTSKKVRF